MIHVGIRDGWGTGTRACVTPRGQLVTAPLEYSTFYNTTANVDDTAFNLVTPQSNKRFVITTITLYANKNVGILDAVVDLYEASSPSSTTIDKQLLKQEMPQKTSLVLTGLNIIVTEGKWINVKTDDNDVFVNIAGYYVEA